MMGLGLGDGSELRWGGVRLEGFGWDGAQREGVAAARWRGGVGVRGLAWRIRSANRRPAPPSTTHPHPHTPPPKDELGHNKASEHNQVPGHPRNLRSKNNNTKTHLERFSASAAVLHAASSLMSAPAIQPDFLPETMIAALIFGSLSTALSMASKSPMRELLSVFTGSPSISRVNTAMPSSSTCMLRFFVSDQVDMARAAAGDEDARRGLRAARRPAPEENLRARLSILGAVERAEVR